MFNNTGLDRGGKIWHNGEMLIGFAQSPDKLLFIALALTAPMASPGGKLSSAARLMRNGELYRLPMQFVKKVLFLSLYLPI